MNNSLLGAQECTDYVNVLQPGDDIRGQNRTEIIPRYNFTCNGRITNITARLFNSSGRGDYPSFQMWRPASFGSTVYTKIGEVQLQPDDQLNEVTNNFLIAIIILASNNTIEVQSGDVVGYYHPPNTDVRVMTRAVDGYMQYEFSGSPETVDLLNSIDHLNFQQPVIQFTVGKCDIK